MPLRAKHIAPCRYVGQMAYASDKSPYLITRLLEEKTRRDLQLSGGFKQELTAHTLFALLVSRHVCTVDAQPSGELKLRKSAKRSSYCNASSNFCS
jgi:hypothetical protein